jgi:hypothetical protein
VICWIHASSRLTIETAFRDVALDRESIDDPVAGRNWFNKLQVPWLLVFDNTDDTTFNLAEYFPHSDCGCIMVTSRNPDCRNLATLGSEQLGSLTDTEACDFLLRTLERDLPTSEQTRNEAGTVVKALGFLPLAIVHAAAYLEKGLCAMGEYPGLLGQVQRRRKLLNHPPTQRLGHLIRTTYDSLEVSANHIDQLCTQNSQDSLQLLRVLAFFSPEKISESIILNAKIGWEDLRTLEEMFKRSTQRFRPTLASTESNADVPVLVWDLD